eukprot:CAMPEP_0180030326 /NCGR_PEP_ID=MMETSP0984-20121128/27315_1 /TAXON_ID=483367 /ORGANISM="non described non described, Strain CCMP 2436" /LENGTH=365 /DNA_ID=CAMNT_0021955389 /DNA_START=19 /DNA_END=1116 /DNA_ORIENTATION=+
MTDLSKPLMTEAYGAKAQGAKLELMAIELPPLTSSQVQVAISDCGLCHTDCHMVNNDWGIGDYPMVPGHEGVGKVVACGANVRGLEVGDTVGVGWIRDSCGLCEPCGCGRENMCDNGYKGTYLGDSAANGLWGKSPNNLFGCFSKVMRIEAKFAFLLPANLPPHVAAPLMCAGGTVFEPIVDLVRPGVVVGVGALGGLGTLALKLSKLYGGKVVAFSGSESKRAAAMAAGADVFVCTKDPKQMADAPKVDVFLDTVPVNRPLSDVLPLLKFNGSYVRMGIPPASSQGLEADWIPIIFTGKKIGGSIVTGSQRMKLMLKLASEHLDFITDISESTQAVVRPFSEVNEAMESLMSQSSSAYRTVLQW